MRAVINSAFPDHGIFGEEYGLQLGTGTGKKYLWVLDPIDGTKSFITGEFASELWCCLHCCLLVHGAHAPVLSCMMRAVQSVAIFNITFAQVMCVLLMDLIHLTFAMLIPHSLAGCCVGKPVFGTLVSLLYEGTPVLGIIDQPILKERWLGVAGQPTTLNHKPVRTRPCTQLQSVYMYSTTPHMFAPGPIEEAFIRVRDSVRIPLYGCDCYAYGLLAAGHVDVVLEADLKPYDYMALVPVIQVGPCCHKLGCCLDISS